MAEEAGEVVAVGGFSCNLCAQYHPHLPMYYVLPAPLVYFMVPEQDRARRCRISGEACVIDNTYFFIRGCLQIPVLDGPGPFNWVTWVSLSRKSFTTVESLWQTPGREQEPPYFGWLSNDLPTYPRTLNLKTHVQTRPVGYRPLIEVEPGPHPLYQEQYGGIVMERVQEIAELVFHNQEKI